MTSDEFHARYRLHERLATGEGIHTHRAEEVGTGRAVMVHRREGAPPETVDRLQHLLALLPAADRSRVLDTASTAEGFVVVTEPIAGLTSFGAWLAERTAATGGPQVGRPPVAGMASGPVPIIPRPSTEPAPEREPPLPSTGEMPVAFSFTVGGPPAGGPAEPAEARGNGGDAPPATGEYTRLYVFGGQAFVETKPTAPDPADLAEFAARPAVTGETPAAGQGAGVGRTTPVASRSAVGRAVTPPRPRVAVAPERRLRPILIAAAIVAVLVLALVLLLRPRGGSPPDASAAAPGRPADGAAPLPGAPAAGR